MRPQRRKETKEDAKKQEANLVFSSLRLPLLLGFFAVAFQTAGS
jgi:hypothetical protein